MGLRGACLGFLTQVARLLSTVRAVEGARAMVFAPHPDDEVLGCGGTIARKLQAGSEVHVVIMTDGAASHRGMIDAAELIAIRRAEAHAACAELGLSSERLVFLDFPDHDLQSFHPQAVQRVAELLRTHAPEEVFVPHRGDRLPDHVETYQIVADAAATLPFAVSIFEYPIWLWNTWPWTRGRPRAGRALPGYVAASLADILRLTLGCRTRVNIRATAVLKHRALAAYASQTQRHNGDQKWPILGDVSDGDFLACFHGDVEFFQVSRKGGAQRTQP